MQLPIIGFRLSILLALCLLSSGCEQNSWLPKDLTELLEQFSKAPQVTTTEAVAEAFRPLYLRLPLHKTVSTLDPSLVQESDASLEVLQQLFLTLTGFNPLTYEAVPELASHWSSDGTGKVYTFQLREDITWSDEQPITAYDVVWSIRRNLSAKTQAPLVRSLFILNNAEAFHKQEITDSSQVGVKALDDYTLEFTLAYPAAYFPALASLPTYSPLPRHAIEQHGDAWTQPENIVINGAYTLLDMLEGEFILLKKNENYYDALNVKIPQIQYFIVPEPKLGLAMYENNELDLMGGHYLPLPYDLRDRLQDELSFNQQLHSSPNFCTESYVFNTQLAPVNNVLVRKAINAAVNRQLIIDFVLNGRHESALTFTRPPTFGAVSSKNSRRVGIPFDLQQAHEWLAEAGYPEGVGLAPLNIYVLHHVDDNYALQVAEALQMMLLQHLGITMQLQFIAYQTLQEYKSLLAQTTQSDAAHLTRLHWCGVYPNAHNWLYQTFHPEAINYARWNNRAFAAAIETAKASADVGEQHALYFRAEQILNAEQAAIVPIYFARDQYLIKPWVQPSQMMAFGGQHLRHWQFRGE